MPLKCWYVRYFNAISLLDQLSQWQCLPRWPECCPKHHPRELQSFRQGFLSETCVLISGAHRSKEKIKHSLKPPQKLCLVLQVNDISVVIVTSASTAQFCFCRRGINFADTVLGANSEWNFQGRNGIQDIQASTCHGDHTSTIHILSCIPLRTDQHADSWERVLLPKFFLCIKAAKAVFCTTLASSVAVASTVRTLATALWAVSSFDGSPL